MADIVGGPAIGTGIGALALLGAFANPIGIIMAPVAVGTGIACAEGARMHPTADADFRGIFGTADASVLQQSLVAQLNGESCRAVAQGAGATIHIERIEVMPGCASADWGYRVTVSWRASRAEGGEIVPLRKTLCGVATDRDVDVWFGESVQSRSEIEASLAAIGERIAAELRASGPPEKFCAVSNFKGNATSR